MKTKNFSLLVSPSIVFFAFQTANAQFIGTGTSGDPFQISTAADMALLATNVNAGTEYYRQMALEAGADYSFRKWMTLKKWRRW